LNRNSDDCWFTEQAGHEIVPIGKASSSSQTVYDRRYGRALRKRKDKKLREAAKRKPCEAQAVSRCAVGPPEIGVSAQEPNHLHSDEHGLGRFRAPAQTGIPDNRLSDIDLKVCDYPDGTASTAAMFLMLTHRVSRTLAFARQENSSKASTTNSQCGISAAVIAGSACRRGSAS